MEIYDLLEGNMKLIYLNRESMNRGNFKKRVLIPIDDTNVLLYNYVKIDDVRSIKNCGGSGFSMWWNGGCHVRLTLKLLSY